jgi:hypothetical protein
MENGDLHRKPILWAKGLNTLPEWPMIGVGTAPRRGPVHLGFHKLGWTRHSAVNSQFSRQRLSCDAVLRLIWAMEPPPYRLRGWRGLERVVVRVNSDSMLTHIPVQALEAR